MSGDFLKRAMVPNTATKVERGVISSKRVHKETLSAFDTTSFKGSVRAGVLPPVLALEASGALSPAALAAAGGGSGPVADGFSIHVSTTKFAPKEYLLSHSGLGGTTSAKAAAEAATRKVEVAAAAAPPKAFASTKRVNPPNTELRRYYERADLPCLIVQSTHNRLKWKADLASLDFHHYLPIFVSGLREVEEPYRFIAQEGVKDLIEAGGEAKVLPVIPQLVLPLKDALATRDIEVMKRTLAVISHIASLGPRAGAALVPYYRQLLPVLNIFVSRVYDHGDSIDYAQRFGHLSEAIQDTLQKLEINGGPDALINIKLLVPTYESAVLG